MSTSLIENLFKNIDARDWNALGALFDANVVYERPGYSPIVGIESLIHFYRHERVISSGRHELDAVVVEDGKAACWGRFVGMSKEGASLNEGFADTYRIVDGRIVGRKSFFFRPAI